MLFYSLIITTAALKNTAHSLIHIMTTSLSDLIVDVHLCEIPHCFYAKYARIRHFLVGGVIINGVLLYAIRRFSRQSLGNYKYLLAFFAAYDIFLTTIHSFATPVSDKMRNKVVIFVSRPRWFLMQRWGSLLIRDLMTW